MKKPHWDERSAMVGVEAVALFLYNVDFDDFGERVFGKERFDGWEENYRHEWLAAWKGGLFGLWNKADAKNKALIVRAALAKYRDEAAREVDFASGEASVSAGDVAWPESAGEDRAHA